MRLMLSYLKRYKGLVFLNFISVFGFALTELGIPTIISKMVDGGVASGDREYLMKMGGLITVISIVGILGTVVLGYCGARISTAVTCDIRNDLFEKVQSFSHREMNQLGVSSLITRTSNDALQIMNFMNIILRTAMLTSGWLKDSILPYMNMILTGLSDSMINAAGIFMNLFIGLVVAIYLLSGRKKFKKQGKLILYSLFKERWANKIVEEIRFADRVFSGFIGGKLLDSAIIGVICYAGMMVLGLPYAILISVIVGVTNIIPFFGPYIGAIPSAIILLTVSPMSCLIFVIFIVILQQVDGNIIGPKILGSSTGLSGIWVLFSILFFGGLFGFVGMLIGVPVFAVIYDLIRQLIVRGLELRNKSKMFDEYELEYPRKD